MKVKEKRLARKLRSQGQSINEICEELGVAKSSVSVWVRDIKLSKKQEKQLSKKGIQKEVIERRRATRLKNENERRDKMVKAAELEITKLSERELWLIGTMLYAAEGGKTQRGLVRFSNGDPEMIKFMMYFFRKTCTVPEEKFRGHIHIHSHLDHEKAEKYWATITGIKRKKFFKTYRRKANKKDVKKNTLPHGVMDIYICDTKLFLRIQGWTNGVFKSY
ncbi:hypothetical protein ACFL2M_00230 [Patescibacteria group bacterium]